MHSAPETAHGQTLNRDGLLHFSYRQIRGRGIKNDTEHNNKLRTSGLKRRLLWGVFFFSPNKIRHEQRGVLMFYRSAVTYTFVGKKEKEKVNTSLFFFFFNECAIPLLPRLAANRPKSLLVYINPYGGKRRGKHIFEQKVAPLFRRAGISTDVIVTQRANHARDHLKTEANLHKYDGVVCVGGDGMFSEILHGLVTRTQTDHSVDQNQPDAQLVPCSLRIGIIPAGSTDCICFATVGTNDPVTSALHIVVGDSQPMDVCSVHHNNVFLKYSVSLLGYGFYGDVLAESERKRWLGPARYDLSGVKTFLSLNYYEGTVSFLPAEDNMGNPRDKLQCRSGCRVCQHKQSKDKLGEMSEEKEKSAKGTNGWNEIYGKFIAINSASMSCACPRSPKGLSPSAHLADGTTDLILVRKCSRLDFFRHLLRHTNKAADQFDHSFVEVHRVRKFHFQPTFQELVSPENQSDPPGETELGPIHPPQTTYYSTARSSWNCDGEILHHADGLDHSQRIFGLANGFE
uniref:Ceramide kinase n=1 Tax=Salarias fasciatus TaxID=181472 RepID=A0A672IN18_SALFA